MLAITFSFTCFLPVFNLVILKRLKLISSFYLEDGKERTFPYVVTALFHIGMVYLIKDFQIDPIFICFLLSSALCIFVTALINLKWKISAHMVGIGGLFGALLFASVIMQKDFLFWVYVLAMVAGLIGFARIQLNAHKPAQVYVGFAVGLLLTFAFLFVCVQLKLYSVF
jgi:hypothetical protein